MKNRLIPILTGLTGLGLMALILALVAWPTPAQAAESPISLTIDASPAAIQAGEQVQFKATLQNTSNANLQNILLTLTLTGPADRMQPAIIQAESSGMRTDRMRREGNVVRWKGDLQAGGQVTLGLRVGSSPIDAGGQGAELKLAGEAGPADGDPVTNASKTVAVTFPGPVDPAQIDLEKRFLDQDGNPLTGMLEGGKIIALPGQQVMVELRLTNNSSQPLYSLLVDSMAPIEATAAAAGQADDLCRLQVSKARVTQGAGFKTPVDALGNPLPDGLMADAITGVFMVKTDPGQTSVARVRARVVGPPDCELAGRLRAYSTAVAPGGELENAGADGMAFNPARLAFIQGLLEQQPKLGPLIALLILLNDYGDAPDSSNHFGVNMTAYAPNVIANFPTVFDPATGAPPGPKHSNGLPLHLGPLVSGEWNADRFARRNLDPNADLADLDVRDDGVDPLTLNFQPCVATTIPFQVTVNQKAVDEFAANGTTAYLNIWLDGNQDGDWEDVLDCDGIQAVEHIVIDQPVAPSTAGLFNLVASTGNIPIPAGGENQPMWLRVTISDEPAEKPFQVTSQGQIIDYGDGRGPANGFRWGETEDYLYVPPAAAQSGGGQGPSLKLGGEAIVQTGMGTAGVQAADASASPQNQVALKTRIRNRGDRTALGARLIVEMDPYGGIPTIETSWTGCLTCTVASRIAPLPDLKEVTTSEWPPVQEVCQGNDCRVEVLLGDMPPGAGGELLMVWKAPANAMEYNFDLRMESNNGGGSSLQAQARQMRRTPVITSPRPGVLGWRGCLTCTVTFKGFANAGVQVGLYSKGFEAGNLSTMTDDKGFWRIDARLPGGTHEVLAWTGCLTCTVTAQDVAAGIPEGSIVSEPLVLTVDDSLDWNPGSFGWKIENNASPLAAAEADDSYGPWSFVDEAGLAELNGWKIPVWPSARYEMGVDLLCQDQAGAKLTWAGGELVFTDSDGDGRFTAVLDASTIGGGQNGVEAMLEIVCGENQATYTGKIVRVDPATVVNGDNGAPLAGVDVTLWERNADADGPQLVPWEAQAFGQSNPQTTDENGHFSFITPAGGYGLTAQIDGFQPFRAGPLRLQQGPFPPSVIALTPVQSGARTVQVRITEDGFDPPVLRVEPGTVVEWVNGDLGVQTTMGGTPDGLTASAASGMNWESGLLAAGERYQVTFAGEGEYTYIDGENPASQGVIRVLPPEEGGASIFLPIVTR